MSVADAHSRSSGPDRTPKVRRGWPIGIAVVVVAIVGVGVTAFVSRGPSGAVASPTTTANSAAAAVNSGPLSVVSVTPSDGTTQIPSDATLSVHFSVPLGAHSPTPSLTPPVAGTWQVVTPDTFTFVASAPFVPLATETVSIPGGGSGVVSAAGKTLAQTSTVRFTVAAGTTSGSNSCWLSSDTSRSVSRRPVR